MLIDLNKQNNINGIKIVQDIEQARDSVLNGEIVTRFEYGDSLSPIVLSGEFLILKPIDREIRLYDIVLCEVNDYLMTHMIVNISQDGKYYLIGSTHGWIFGWTDKIYALCENFDNDINKRCFILDKN